MMYLINLATRFLVESLWRPHHSAYFLCLSLAVPASPLPFGRLKNSRTSPGKPGQAARASRKRASLGSSTSNLAGFGASVSVVPVGASDDEVKIGSAVGVASGVAVVVASGVAVGVLDGAVSGVSAGAAGAAVGVAVGVAGREAVLLDVEETLGAGLAPDGAVALLGVAVSTGAGAFGPPRP